MKKLFLMVLTLALSVSMLTAANARRDGSNPVSTGKIQDVKTYNSRDYILEESFESAETPAGWTLIDGDGDGVDWFFWTSADTTAGPSGYNGTAYTATSASWSGSALTPDNYMITPALAIENGSELTFAVEGQDPSYAAEHYAVLVSTTGTAVADFTDNLLEEESTAAWVEKTLDLSAYAGQTIYIAFRHYNISDMFRLNIDEVKVSGGSTPPVVWTEILSDDFEGTTDKWALEGTWGLTDEGAQSPTHSLTESPNANYADNLEISATLANALDLSAAAGAKINFNYKSDIESGFDYMYLELTTDDTTWTNLKTYDEEDGSWKADSVDISGFVGNAAVKLRFRFKSDGGYNTVGMLIDDFVVSTTTTDVFAPFIMYQGPTFYEGTNQDFAITATALDYSDVASVKAVYTLNNDSTEFESAPFTNNGDNTWTGFIPEQLPGVEVDYKIVATDVLNNVGEKDGFAYIAGIHLIKDNGVVDFFSEIKADTQAAGAAVTFEMPAGSKSLDYILIRNYMDVSGHTNDSMLVHVWADGGGMPGADLITPIMVFPEANPANTSAMTRVDLRPYVSQLDELNGQLFWIGFTVPSGKVHITMTNPGLFDGSSFVFDVTSGVWSEFESTSGKADFHFRAIVGSSEGIQKEITTVSSFKLQQNYPNPFNPTTSISFALENNSNVKLMVFDSKGALVANLVNGNVNKGLHSVEFNATGLATGVYYYSLNVNGVSSTKKMLLIK